jgi:hypothetical protein
VAGPSATSQAPGPVQRLDLAYKARIDRRRWWIETEFVDVLYRVERAAIMEFNGGMTRADA